MSELWSAVYLWTGPALVAVVLVVNLLAIWRDLRSARRRNGADPVK